MPAAKKKTAKRPKKTSKRKGAARKRAAPVFSLNAALAEAAWAEADTALALALADMDELLDASDPESREAAMAMLAQSLGGAARKRGLMRVGELGAKEVFDPKRHSFVGSVAKPPKTIRITARGVTRGGEMLVAPRVGPVRRKKKRP